MPYWEECAQVDADVPREQLRRSAITICRTAMDEMNVYGLVSRHNRVLSKESRLDSSLCPLCEHNSVFIGNLTRQKIVHTNKKSYFGACTEMG